MKLNFGCGETQLAGFINIDLEVNTKSKVKPNLVCDIKKGYLPFGASSFEVIHMLHVLEHIETDYWIRLFEEIHRVLIPKGRLILAYPEFEVCAKYFLENYRGRREFWQHCLYGRQLYPGDYHVVPMRTSQVVYYLSSLGFKDIKHCPEVDEEWSTFLTCIKGDLAVTREMLFKKEVFN